jgi:hypothetical protein
MAFHLTSSLGEIVALLGDATDPGRSTAKDHHGLGGLQ